MAHNFQLIDMRSHFTALIDNILFNMLKGRYYTDHIRVYFDDDNNLFHQAGQWAIPMKAKRLCLIP